MSCGSTQLNQEFNRADVIAMLTSFGGILYTIRHFSNAFNRKAADFCADNTMMRKLYAVRAQDSKLFADRQSKDPLPTVDAKLVKFMQERTSFYYSYRNYCKRCLCHSCLFCCCFNCCCKRKDTIEDRIFDKAQKRLYQEIDIMHVIKQLRISAFVASL